jgi:hypothetical protein
MHGLQKLKKVCVSGINKVYIDEASSLESLDFYHYCLDAPFKVDFIHCKYLKELLLRLNRTTIITNKWFLEIFPKFSFLERLEIWNCVLSETINISSVQLKYLEVSDCSNLKEASIDAPNLLLCKFSGFKGSKPIISFLNISSQLEVYLDVLIDEDLDVFYVRELLQNIKPENVLISLSLYIFYSEVSNSMHELISNCLVHSIYIFNLCVLIYVGCTKTGVLGYSIPSTKYQAYGPMHSFRSK